METRRLYWEEPFKSTFRARIIKVVDINDRVGIVLDETLFHPEGGGQAADRGFITVLSDEATVVFGRSDLKITDVVEDGTEIVHFLDSEFSAAALPGGLPEVLSSGWEVQGSIDWDFRFDLMQQHTGQHILSRAFEDLLDARTAGFHLAQDYVSIDLAIQSLSDDDRARVEDKANKVVFSGVSVTTKEYEKGELPREIRTRLPIDAERVRVVSVGDFDACACAGTHVTDAGQVGLIKINEVDRAHGGVRVVFRCGKRALEDYREKERLLGETAGLLSVKYGVVPATVGSLLERSRNMEKDLEETHQAVLSYEVESRARSVADSGEAAVVEAFDSLTPDQLKFAARKISESAEKLTVCFCREPRFSAVVISPTGNVDARVVVSRIALRWGGRGGGTPGLAQLGSKEPLSVPDSDVIAGVREACMEVLAGAQ